VKNRTPTGTSSGDHAQLGSATVDLVRRRCRKPDISVTFGRQAVISSAFQSEFGLGWGCMLLLRDGLLVHWCEAH
jgi:hypothetical protein